MTAYPDAVGAGVTVPLIGIDTPPAVFGVYEVALVCTVTVVPAAEEKNGPKESRRMTAIASAPIPAIVAVIPRLWTEFSVCMDFTEFLRDCYGYRVC